MDYFKGAYDAARQKVDSYMGTDIEKAVKAATSNENWGSSNTIKNEIAHYTFDYNDCKEVMGVIWKKLEETGANWRQVFKALQLLEYLLKNGHERVSQECRDMNYKIRSVQDFQYYDSDNRDRGRGIREQVKILMDLVENTDKLREARKASEKTRRKLASGSASQSSAGYGNNYSNQNSSWNTGSLGDSKPTTWGDDDEDDAGVKKKKKKKKKKKTLDFSDEDDSSESEVVKKKKKKKKKKKDEILSEEDESSDSDKRKKKKKKKKKKKAATEDDEKFGFDSDGDEAADRPKVQGLFSDLKISGPSQGKSGANEISFDTDNAIPIASSVPDPFGDFQSSPQNDLFGAPVSSTGRTADLFGQPAPVAVQAAAAPKPTVAADDDWLTSMSAAPAAPQNQGTNFFDTAPTSQVNKAQQPDFFSADFIQTSQPERKVDNSGVLDFGFASQPQAMKPVPMTAQPVPQPVVPQPVGIEKPKKNDAWGLGDGLVNLTNLNKSDNKYAAFDPNSKNIRPNHMLPSLNTAPQKISFTSFNANTQPNPMMRGRGHMHPNQQMMGRAPQPHMGMGMQYPQTMQPQHMGMAMQPNYGMQAPYGQQPHYGQPMRRPL